MSRSINPWRAHAAGIDFGELDDDDRAKTVRNRYASLIRARERGLVLTSDLGRYGHESVLPVAEGALVGQGLASASSFAHRSAQARNIHLGQKGSISAADRLGVPTYVDPLEVRPAMAQASPLAILNPETGI